MWHDLVTRHRAVAPDLLGYGASSPWPAPPARPPTNDLDLLERLIARVPGPVHLVGHSSCGAVCLEAARRDAASGAGTVRSLFLIEPVAFHVLRSDGPEAEWRTVSRVAQRCIRAAELGHRRAAAAPCMSFWLGRLRWWLMPGKTRRAILETIDKVAAEFRIMFEVPFTTDDYRAIACPTTLLRRGRTRAPAVAVVRRLGEVIDGARMREIPGAGHMSPFTRRAQVKEAIVSHLEELG